MCHSTSNRRVIPAEAIMQIWNEKGIFVQKGSRICGDHLDGNLLVQNILENIVPTRLGIHMTPEEVSRWMKSSVRQTVTRPPRLNFTDRDVSDEEYEYLIPGGIVGGKAYIGKNNCREFICL